MPTVNQQEVDELRNRIQVAEDKLREIKYILIAVACLVTMLLIPPVAAVLVVSLIVGVTLVALLAYMFSVIWACERLFKGTVSRHAESDDLRPSR